MLYAIIREIYNESIWCIENVIQKTILKGFVEISAFTLYGQMFHFPQRFSIVIIDLSIKRRIYGVKCEVIFKGNIL